MKGRCTAAAKTANAALVDAARLPTPRASHKHLAAAWPQADPKFHLGALWQARMDRKSFQTRLNWLTTLHTPEAPGSHPDHGASLLQQRGQRIAGHPAGQPKCLQKTENSMEPPIAPGACLTRAAATSASARHIAPGDHVSRRCSARRSPRGSSHAPQQAVRRAPSGTTLRLCRRAWLGRLRGSRPAEQRLPVRAVRAGRQVPPLAKCCPRAQLQGRGRRRRQA